MVVEKTAGVPGRFEVRPTSDSHFSWMRTRMSAERTLMSWVRTSVALIGFGFTIFQFFQRFNAMPGVEAARRPMAAYYFSLALIAAGTVGLFISAGQYRAVIRHLSEEDFQPIAGVSGKAAHTPTLAITFLLMLTGLFAFAAVLLRVR